MSQRDLFRPMLASQFAHQLRMFADAGHGRESNLSCGVCGEPLVETPSGFLACPRGHGRLLQEAVSDEVADWTD